MFIQWSFLVLWPWSLEVITSPCSQTVNTGQIAAFSIRWFLLMPLFLSHPSLSATKSSGEWHWVCGWERVCGIWEARTPLSPPAPEPLTFQCDMPQKWRSKHWTWGKDHWGPQVKQNNLLLYRLWLYLFYLPLHSPPSLFFLLLPVLLFSVTL